MVGLEAKFVWKLRGLENSTISASYAFGIDLLESVFISFWAEIPKVGGFGGLVCGHAARSCRICTGVPRLGREGVLGAKFGGLGMRCVAMVGARASARRGLEILLGGLTLLVGFGNSCQALTEHHATRCKPPQKGTRGSTECPTSGAR